MKIKFILILIFYFFLTAGCSTNETGTSTNDDFTKQETYIEMRDGVKLFTIILFPDDRSTDYPILLMRTPYSSDGYSKNQFKKVQEYQRKEKFIFVFQDVRGKFMSEGEYINMRPHIPNKLGREIDESSDTYDTIEWLVNNVENNNGNVGLWGISYPGFYAAMGAIEAHPALKFVSPQAPIADWFIGDDMHHNGALSLLLSFNFFQIFDLQRDSLHRNWPRGIEYTSPDAYTFFLKMGAIKNFDKKILKGKIPFWKDIVSNPDYNNFWKSRSTMQYLDNIRPAVMTVGGWFDGENLFGALNTYKSIEEKNPEIINKLVVGPWIHGGWVRTNGDSLGDIYFGSNTSDFYKNQVELPIYKQFLKNEEAAELPEALMFCTGSNEWHKLNQWPPAQTSVRKIFIDDYGSIIFEPENISNDAAFDKYISDPSKPVPYTAQILDSKSSYAKSYLIEDQRFASTRPDVLVYQSDPLEEDITIAGPFTADLYVSTSGTDSDFIVKIIDCYPDEEPDPSPNPNKVEMGGYQQLVRGDIMRGKYRNSFENPEPFVPNEVTNIKFKLQDVFHTFKAGHKIMIQIQSSWFPLFDRNPQRFINIYQADDSDFQKAEIKIYHTKKYPSSIECLYFESDNKL